MTPVYELTTGTKNVTAWFVTINIPHMKVKRASIAPVPYSHMETVGDSESLLRYIEEREDSDEVKTFHSMEDMLTNLGIE